MGLVWKPFIICLLEGNIFWAPKTTNSHGFGTHRFCELDISSVSSIHSQTVFLDWLKTQKIKKKKKKKKPQENGNSVSLTISSFTGKNIEAVNIGCLVVVWVLLVPCPEVWTVFRNTLCLPWIVSLTSSLCADANSGGAVRAEGLPGPRGQPCWSPEPDGWCGALWDGASRLVWELLISSGWRTSGFVGQFSSEPDFENLHKTTKSINAV